MQSYLTPFLPNTAMAKKEMHSLLGNCAHVFGMSLENTIQGYQVTTNMGHVPALIIKRSVLITGSAILSIAIRYRALLDRWILHKFAVSQGAPTHSAMLLRSCWQRISLPLFVGIGFLMARLYNYISIHSFIYGRQVIRSVEANIQSDSVIENNELSNQQSIIPSLFGGKHVYARLALQCIFSTAMLKAQLAPKSISFKARCLQKKHDISALRSIVARNGQWLTYIGALVTLQIFLQLNKVNTTSSLLPMLFQTTSSRSRAAVVGNIVIILVNSCGILGSAFTIKQHGRAATLTVSVVLMVFCQIAIPSILEFHIGLGGGSRMPRGYTAAMFVLTCVVSCGLSWSWGSMFWTVPGNKTHSAGQVAGMALNLVFCFAQMQYFLVLLWRLRSALLAYYAMWIWS
ncbi:sugar transport protein MST1 [Lolium perenne]|uniref:sugar transport protein MST1 n=1 Tax=Lolium perenne TaxID=4522 RepID=UPI0021EB3B4B|nr:sugar transport protein MST1-like [Lolium perenne]XP_051209382.1 sugar transport protein MST1-like [Lolium perenne]